MAAEEAVVIGLLGIMFFLHQFNMGLKNTNPVNAAVMNGFKIFLSLMSFATGYALIGIMIDLARHYLSDTVRTTLQVTLWVWTIVGTITVVFLTIFVALLVPDAVKLLQDTFKPKSERDKPREQA